MNSINCKPGVFIPKYTTYGPDRFGRDKYIIYNNGGFLDKLNKITLKEKHEYPSSIRYFNTKRNVAPFKYRSDGSGRDTYVLHEHAGLERDHKSLKTYNLKDFLRRPESHSFNFRSSPMREGVSPKTLYISKKEHNATLNIKSLEKSLADRLYYSHKQKIASKEGNKEFNYKSTLRNYNSNHSYSNSMGFNGNNVSHDFSMNNTFSKNENLNYKNENSNLPKIQEDENKKIFTLIKNRNSYKEGNMLKFINSKSKIKQRLELMSREKINMTNSSFGKRIIIKNLKNTIIDDGLSKTTKCFNMK